MEWHLDCKSKIKLCFFSIATNFTDLLVKQIKNAMEEQQEGSTQFI